jgi:hypothetical protein
MSSFPFFFLSFSSFLLFSFVSSDPITGCISNGHYYEVVTGSWTWDQAVTAASLMQYDGMTGYLATITSVEENIFIRGLLEPGPGNHHWFGGSAADDTSSPSSYQWATGPETGVTFFQPPTTCLGSICDFDGSLSGTFQRLSMIISPSIDGWEVLSSSTVVSYMVVEYGGLCVDIGMTGSSPSFPPSLICLFPSF